MVLSLVLRLPAMRACPSCRGSVARNVYVCPHCGHRFHTLLAKLFFLIIVVPLVIAVVYGFVASTP